MFTPLMMSSVLTPVVTLDLVGEVKDVGNGLRAVFGALFGDALPVLLLRREPVEATFRCNRQLWRSAGCRRGRHKGCFVLQP